MFQDLKTAKNGYNCQALSLEDDETVQGDLEKELVEYESINFLTISYTLEEIIFIQLIKI